LDRWDRIAVPGTGCSDPEDLDRMRLVEGIAHSFAHLVRTVHIVDFHIAAAHTRHLELAVDDAGNRLLLVDRSSVVRRAVRHIEELQVVHSLDLVEGMVNCDRVEVGIRPGCIDPEEDNHLGRIADRTGYRSQTF